MCEWAGLTLTEDEVVQRAREFEAMVEGTGSVGPRNWRGHLLRARTERWMRNVVRRIRAGNSKFLPDVQPLWSRRTGTSGGISWTWSLRLWSRSTCSGHSRQCP